MFRLFINKDGEGFMNFILIKSTRDRFAKIMHFFILLVCLLIAFGTITLNFNIEFTGGSVYTLDAPVADSKAKLSGNDQLLISGSNMNSIVKTPLNVEFTDSEKSFIDEHMLSKDIVGASMGQELRRESVLGLALALLGVLIYLSVRYNYTMAFAALFAVMHDVVFTIFMLALFNVQVSSIVIGAFLAIIGYSINDSVVTLDRMRELIRDNEENPIQQALEMTLQRNINTAVSTLIVIVALFIFGGVTMQAFAFTMFVGVGVGMFSSLTIVPCLVSARESKGSLVVSRKPSLEGEL